jgi:hypothetical protein
MGFGRGPAGCPMRGSFLASFIYFPSFLSRFIFFVLDHATIGPALDQSSECDYRLTPTYD